MTNATEQTTFVRLAGAAVRFRKEVLRVWEGVDPNTGKPLEFTRETLLELANNTNKWIALGHEVPAPGEGHTDKAMSNLGRWLSFDVEGDGLFGVFEPADAEVAAATGTRMRGVSIYARGPVLASAGVTLGFTILHVCLTPTPVLPNQENFVRLAREMHQESQMTVPAADPKAVKLAADPAADPTASSGMSPKEFLLKAEGILGLKDATWDDVFEALRASLIDEAGESDAAPVSMAPAVMARLARQEKAVEARLSARFAADLEGLKKVATATREAHARDLIELSRKRSAESGVLFGKEESDGAFAMLSSDSEQMQKAGRLMLAAQDKLADGALKLAQSGRRVATPEAEQKAKLAIAESDDGVAFITGQKPTDKTRTLAL